jgi:Spy/CpxP family protein refolding chaperone
MMIRFLKIALAVSIFFNLSVLVSAGYFYYTHSAYWVTPFGSKIQKGRFLFEELSLKPEQIRAMKKKAAPFRAEIDRKREEIAGTRNALVNLMRADIPDKEAIKNRVADISRVQQEIESMVAVHILEEKIELNKEQQKKFFDLIQNAMTKGRELGCSPIQHN